HLKQEYIDRRAVKSEKRVAKKVQERVEEVVTELAIDAVDRWGEEARQAAAAKARQSQGQPSIQSNGSGSPWYPQTAPQQPGPYNLPAGGRPQLGRGPLGGGSAHP